MSSHRKDKKDRKDKKCRRRLKPKSTDSQSMTGWLFKRDFCRCQDNGQGSAEPVKILIPPRLMARSSRSPSDKLVIGGIVAACGISLALCAAIAPDLPTILSPFIGPRTARGSDRILFVMDSSCFNNRIRFDNAAIAIIAQEHYPAVALVDAEISDTELAHLGQITTLEQVSLRRCRSFTQTGLLSLADGVRIKSLAVENSPLTQQCLEALATSHLEVLDLSYSKIDGADWQCLARIPTLKKFVVFGVKTSSQNKKYLEMQNFEGSEGVYRRQL